MDVPKWKFWKRHRYVVTIMAFLGFFNVFALRVNVSVAIVAMTSPSSQILENGTHVEEPPEFNWDSKVQGLVLGSYFYGYITTQILGGWLATRLGGNLLFGLGLAVTSVLTLLTPPLAKLSVYWFIAIRVIEGIFEGITYPSMHDVWAHWAPPLERSRLSSFAYAGSYVGTVVVMPISGLLAHHVGWSSVFYIFGAIALLWCLAWWMLVSRGPKYDHRIDPRELKYLEDTLPPVAKNVNHPWRAFVTSAPVWAIIVANFSENWGFYTLLTQLPIFMKETLAFDIQEAGLLSALPYIVVTCILQMAGHIADYLLRRKIVSTTQVRKLFCSGGFLCQSLFMFLASYLLTPVGAIMCLSFAVGFGAFAISAFFVNHLDIAPPHASILMGIGNTFGTMPGIISPTITGYIVQEKTTSEWQIIFYISSGIYLFGSIFYAIFGSGEIQSWVKIHQNDETKGKS